MAAKAETFTPPIEPVQTGGESRQHDNRQESTERESIHENSRGATELASLDRLRRNYSRASTRYAGSPLSEKPTTVIASLTAGIRKFWRRQISITVDHQTCRDHLALERTFLGYLRTSLALSMMGITVAQLFRLQHAPMPNNHIGFYVLGKPLSCICQGAAIYSLAIGCFRTWRTQNAIVRGKAISGGFEIVALALGLFILLLVFLILLIIVNVLKEDLVP